MTTRPSTKPRPFFLPSQGARLFALYHEPAGNLRGTGNVLVVPAFNEEMNRCRSMLTLQAQALAEIGIGTLIIDLYGTGESEGQYGDARWERWIDNVGDALAWLSAQPGGCTALLGVRLGVPLALAAMGQCTGNPALIAWQPVIDGKTYFTQFMRMRIAANMDRTDIPKETTSTMRAQLSSGTSIEIAGYEVHPEMAHALESLQLAKLLPPEKSPVAWFEKALDDTGVCAPASETLFGAWREAGRTPQAFSFDGPAFWALHDRFLAPDLLQQTTKWLQPLTRAK